MGSEMSAVSADWTPDPIENSAESIATGWKARLLVGKRGGILGNVANSLIALRHAPEWQGVLHFDESSLATVAKAVPPFERTPDIPFDWADEHDVLTAAWLQHQGISVNKEIAGQAIQVVARERSFHPIRAYLNGLVWDKIPRIDKWLTQYLGVKPSDYVRAVGAKFLIGGAARIYKPGCKVDTSPILEGSQGTQKSTALRTLAGDEFFTDDFAEMGSKDSVMGTRGVWIIELGELDSMTRPDVSRVKAFMSRQVDRIRPPYGRRIMTFPRECIFAGSTNKEDYLKDETGGRRWWPVQCGRINIDELQRDRDQLWAEAVVRYRAGETWWLDSQSLVEAAASEQQDRYDADPWQPVIEKWIDGRESVTVEEVLGGCLLKQPKDRRQGDQNRVAVCLKVLKWVRYQKRLDPKNREWRYRKSQVSPDPDAN
jgi:predicted P-loop ATPase